MCLFTLKRTRPKSQLNHGFFKNASVTRRKHTCFNKKIKQNKNKKSKEKEKVRGKVKFPGSLGYPNQLTPSLPGEITRICRENILQNRVVHYNPSTFHIICPTIVICCMLVDNSILHPTMYNSVEKTSIK